MVPGEPRGAKPTTPVAPGALCDQCDKRNMRWHTRYQNLTFGGDAGMVEPLAVNALSDIGSAE